MRYYLMFSATLLIIFSLGKIIKFSLISELGKKFIN